MADVCDRFDGLIEQDLQRGIDAALNRPVEEPEEDEHGNRICKECGEIIHKMRLMVIPEAVRCMPCQEEVEG